MHKNSIHSKRSSIQTVFNTPSLIHLLQHVDLLSSSTPAAPSISEPPPLSEEQSNLGYAQTLILDPTEVEGASTPFLDTEPSPSQNDRSHSLNLSVSVSAASQDSLTLNPSFKNRYTYLGHLGSGGMGKVHRVYDQMLNRVVALKTLHPFLLKDKKAVLRFIQEAQIGSQLQHPNIIPVYDFGLLEQGSLYFTMVEIQGIPFHRCIRFVHYPEKEIQSTLDSKFQRHEWNIHRLIQCLYDLCKAVSFAHEHGVIHRDLKPENIMIGDFDEVLVVDWGLAQINDESHRESRSNSFSSDQLDSIDSSGGTPGYLAPELIQLSSRHIQQYASPESDLFSLGVILYEILTGTRPIEGQDPYEILRNTKHGKIKDFNHFQSQTLPSQNLLSTSDFQTTSYLSSKGQNIPSFLVDLCQRALAYHPEERTLNSDMMAVEEFTDALGQWLDGSQQYEYALECVQQAKDVSTSLIDLQNQIDHLESKCSEYKKLLNPWSPEDEFALYWDQEDRIFALKRKQNQLQFKKLQLLQEALIHKDDLVEAHRLLIKFYKQQHQEAEKQNDLKQIDQSKVSLLKHLQGLPENHALKTEVLEYLEGQGSITLETQPTYTQLTLFRQKLKYRRFILDEGHPFGNTPLHKQKLNRGSFIIRIESDGYHPVQYPILIERNDHLLNIDPSGNPYTLDLLPLGTLNEDECYVPTGWCWLGGDPNTPNSLPKQRVWIDGFVIHKYPVTHAQYLLFLNDLIQSGHKEDALEHAPREQSSSETERGTLLYSMNQNGLFKLPKSSDVSLGRPNQPVTMIRWQSSRAYAEWLGTKTGYPWRLPMEFEWEKAARGVDGRFYPWGNEHLPSWSCMKDSHQGEIQIQEVYTFPVDESIYGVRGTAGNTRDWCLDRFREEGPPLDQFGRLLMPTQADLDDMGFKSTRGGSYGNSASRARSADRDWWFPNRSYVGRGFRLVWSIKEWKTQQEKAEDP